MNESCTSAQPSPTFLTHSSSCHQLHHRMQKGLLQITTIFMKHNMLCLAAKGSKYSKHISRRIIHYGSIYLYVHTV